MELTIGFLLEVGTLLLKEYGRSRDEADQITDAAPTMDVAPLITSLDALQTSTDEIVDVLKHPTRTAGDEMLDRANYAFKRGWYEEAQRDASESVRLFPFRPAAQLLRAISSLAVGDAQATVEALSDTVRYSVDEELPIGCTAALIAANLADASNAPDAAVDGLREFREKSGDQFPEILLALHLRVPDDEEVLTALTGALVGMGLDPIHPSDKIRGITRQLDAFFESRSRCADDVKQAHHDVDAAEAALERARARTLPKDQRFLAFLSAVDGVRLSNRTALTTAQLLAAYAGTSLDSAAGVEAAKRVQERATVYETLEHADAGPLKRTADLDEMRSILAAYIRIADELNSSRERLRRAETVASTLPSISANPGRLLRAAYPVPLSIASGRPYALPDLDHSSESRMAGKGKGAEGKTNRTRQPEPKMKITHVINSPKWRVNIRFGDDHDDWYTLRAAIGEPITYYRNGKFLRKGSVLRGTQSDSVEVEVKARRYRIVQRCTRRWLKGPDIVVSVETIRGRVLASSAFSVN